MYWFIDDLPGFIWFVIKARHGGCSGMFRGVLRVFWGVLGLFWVLQTPFFLYFFLSFSFLPFLSISFHFPSFHFLSLSFHFLLKHHISRTEKCCESEDRSEYFSGFRRRNYSQTRSRFHSWIDYLKSEPICRFCNLLPVSNCIQMIGEVLTATVLVYDELVNISMDETSI